MIEKLSFRVLFWCLFVCIFGLSFMETSYSEESEVTELRLALHTPPPAMPNRIASLWGEKVEKKTGGRVKVTIHPSESLVKMRDMFPATEKGICDIGFAPLDMETSRYPLNLIMEIGLMDWPGGQAPTRIWSELQDRFPEMKREFEGVKVLWHYVAMPTTLHLTNKKVRVPEDLEGLKIEAAGPRSTAMKTLGATPMVMPPSEWYMALDRGIENGICHNWTPLFSLKVHKLLHYHTDVNFGLIAQAFIMNQEEWNSLPTDIQKIITELRPWIEKKSVELSNNESERVKKRCKDLGQTVITPTPEEMKLWHRAAIPMFENWIANNAANGPAQEIFEETKGLIQEYSR